MDSIRRTSAHRQHAGELMQGFWTDELKQRVAELWVDHSATQICEKLALEGISVTRNAVIGVLHRMNLTIERKVRVHPLTRREPGQRRPRGPRPPALSVSFRSRIGDGPAAFLRCVETKSRNLTLEQLEHDDCRYPFGDEPPFTFCGRIKTKNSSYCIEHLQLCRGIGTSSERAAGKVTKQMEAA